MSQALLQAQAVKEHTLKQKQLTMAGRDAKVDMYLPIITYLLITYLSSPTYHHLPPHHLPPHHLSSPTYLITHHLPKVDMVIGRDAKGQQLVHRDIFASTNEKIVQGSCDCEMMLMTVMTVIVIVVIVKVREG